MTVLVATEREKAVATREGRLGGRWGFGRILLEGVVAMVEEGAVC